MTIEKDGGPDEEGQASLSDDLAKAWSDMEAGEQPEKEEVSDGRARDEKGRFVAKEGDAGEVEAEEQGEQEQQAGAPPAISAPEHWSQADKDQFNSLPEEIKPLYLEKAKSLESGFNKKFEDVANERKSFEAYKGLRDAIEPYRQQLALAGTTPEAYFQMALAWMREVETNPQNAIPLLARKFNVDIGKPQGAEQDEYADPVVAALKAEVQETRQMLQNLYAQQQQGTIQTYEQEWTGFQNAKDANGNALFPSADKLKVRMGHELNISPPQPGESIRQAFERAYETVKWNDPELRKSILEAEAKSKEAERQRKADLERAKKAGGPSIKGKTSPNSDSRTPGKDWKEELERNWDQAQA